MWNLESDENYMISLTSADKTIPRSDRISDIAFNPQKSVLAAGTAGGHVVMWRRLGTSTVGGWRSRCWHCSVSRHHVGRLRGS